ncbi:MAG: hypothetical protein CW691_11040 [Candidatus Bathyarchaeum sp.]|nr:MAG: hypothetical protein CW691_11040 [Candidatus Bathyarchaeum sp.]
MSQGQYNSPAVGSIGPLMSKDGKDITGDIINSVSSLLAEKGIIKPNAAITIHHHKKVVHKKDYLNIFPKRLHAKQWIDTGNGLAVIHPGTSLPFFLNDTGSKICRLCDGEHTIKDMLNIFHKKWSSLPRKRLETDFLQFLLLVEELDLINLA